MSDAAAATATAPIGKPARGAIPNVVYGVPSTQVSVSIDTQKSSNDVEQETTVKGNQRDKEEDHKRTSEPEASKVSQEAGGETKGGEDVGAQVGGEGGVDGDTVADDDFDETADHGPSGWIECVDPWIDEVILQLVRDIQSGLGSDEKIDETFWENVAAALNQLSGGAVVVGESVRSRMEWLTSVFLDDAHEEFGKLTETMYNHLAAHLQFVSKRGPQKTALSTSGAQAAKQAEKEESTQTSTQARQNDVEREAAPVNQKPHQTQPDHHSQSTKDAASAISDRIASGRKRTFRGANGKAVVIPDIDEVVMELVIEQKRALPPDGVFVMPMWQNVADAVNLKKGPAFKNGRGAQSRVHWLVSVLNESLHQENANLTPSLRSRLKEYSDFGLQRRIRRLSASPGDSSVLAASCSAIGPTKVSPVSTVENQPAPKAMVEVAEDEKLLRLLLDKADLLLEIDRKMKVWNALAEASRGRFRSGWAVQQRVIFLTKVLNDPTHSEHKALSTDLREMILKYSGYAERLRQRRAPASSTASTSKSNEREDTSSESNDVIATDGEIPLPKGARGSDDEDYEPILPKTHDKSSIDPEVDARTLRLVLAKEGAFMTTARRMQVWDDIARDSRGRYASGWSAHGHVTWLLRVFNDPSIEQHSSLPATMRELLAKFKEMYARMRESQVHSPGRRSKDAKKLSDKKVAAGKLKKTEETKKTEESSKPSGNGHVPGTPGTPTQPRRPLMVKPKFDEMLTKLVIAKLPFPIFRDDRVKMWNSIADVIREKYPKIKGGLGVKTRFKWLLTVLGDPSHVEYANLTKKLRANLTIFGGVKTPVTPVKPKPVEPETNDLSRDNEWTEEADRKLIRGALRFRPFRSKPGKRMESWERVASQLNEDTKVKAPVTGHHCLYRVRKLLATFQGRINGDDVRLTEEMRVMLGLMEKMQKMKWPEADADLSSKHQKLLANADKLLNDDPEKASSLNFVHLKPVKTDAAPTPAKETKPNVVEMPASASKRKLKWDENEHESEAEIRLVPAKKHQAAPTTSVKKTTSFLKPIPLSEDTSLFKGLERRIDEVCATADRDRAMLTTQLSALREEITSQSAVLMNKIEQERKEHRAELQTLVEMLKNDREMHNRETATMLEVIKKEREDRREEFVAMMNLVTRTVLQQQP